MVRKSEQIINNKAVASKSDVRSVVSRNIDLPNHSDIRVPNYPRLFKDFGTVKINVMNHLQKWLERVEYEA